MPGDLTRQRFGRINHQSLVFKRCHQMTGLKLKKKQLPLKFESSPVNFHAVMQQSRNFQLDFRWQKI